MKRRDILKSLSFMPLAGGLTSLGIPMVAKDPASVLKKDLFKELGLHPFINAAGNYTTMTGSIMPESVMEAIQGSSRKYVKLDEVQDKVGEKIAALCHAEAATVTAGCWSAMVLGMAGVLTGMDNKNVRLLPQLEGTGMKSEVILQKSHAIGYEHALYQAGVKFVVVETREELEDAINEKTAMLWFL